MRRVARLIQAGAKPRRMLVSTFTRTAAHDLQNELALLGVDGAEEVRAGTIHALCFGILQQADVLKLTDRHPRPLLDFEQRFLLEDLAAEGLGGIRDLGRRLKAFNAAWARLQTEEPGWPKDPADRAFRDALLGWFRFHKAMLIGEVVPETLRYLRDNPESKYRRSFAHVLVDEYQDLNRAEQVLLDLLAGEGTLTVVGDEDQSIYSFKHAHPEGIATFDQTHPGTHDEDLLECRRCPRLVVELAKTLISQNRSRARVQQLRPVPTNVAGEVYVVQWPSMGQEARGIAQFIGDRVKSGRAEAGRVLVLAPRRQFGYAIRDALKSFGVSAHSFFNEEALDGDPKGAEESAAQQAMTLLTLLANPDDRVALRCWCGFGSPSLRSSAWQRLRTHCEASGESPRDVLQRLAIGELTIPRTGELIARFRELEANIKGLSGLRGPKLVEALFPESGDWAEPLRSMTASVDDDSAASDVLDSLRSGVTQPELPTDVDYVRVMSLHKSKGLTADLVVVVGCIEGLVPFLDANLPPQEQDRTLEEQRRLFYVAMTRTRETLVLSSVLRFPRDIAYQMRAKVTGGNRTHSNAIASRFLGELGPQRPTAVSGAALLNK